MRRATFVAATLAGAGVLAGASTAYASLAPRMHELAPDETGVLACHVAWDGSARAPVLDHREGSGCAGFTGASVDGQGRINVTHTYDPVVAIIVTPDEAAAGRGLTAGASGGSARTMLTITDARVGRRLYLHTEGDADRVGSGSGWWLVITNDAR